MDKNQVLIDYLISCPSIKNNPLFFNFIEAKDNATQLVITGNEKSLDKPYIDGSVEKLYTFTIIDYKSVVYQAVVKLPGYTNENVSDLMDVQGIIDWITEQNNLKNFPNFGNKCEVEEIKAMTSNPTLNGVDTAVSPGLAKYSISIQIKYLDKTGVIWNS